MINNTLILQAYTGCLRRGVPCVSLLTNHGLNLLDRQHAWLHNQILVDRLTTAQVVYLLLTIQVLEIP